MVTRNSVWTLNPEGCKYLGFQKLHPLRIPVIRVIIPKEVQQTMDHKVADMVGQSPALTRRLAPAGLVGESDIPEIPAGRKRRITARGHGRAAGGRPAQHVGGPALAAEIPVERLDPRIVATQEAEAERRRIEVKIFQCCPRRIACERIEPGRFPARVLNDGIHEFRFGIAAHGGAGAPGISRS